MKNTNNTIPYKVKRSKRSTVSIIIERDGSVLVRAPKCVDDEQVENIVNSKLSWIYKNLEEWKDLNTTRVFREYKNGEGFLYLGRSYRLLLVDKQSDPLQLKDDRFCLRRDIIEGNDIEAAKHVFREFYTKKANEYIQERVAYFAPKVGVQHQGIEVSDTGNQWGTCSPVGKLTFHWKCMMATQTSIDYIVVHELCHLHHMDHTEAFWNEVDKVLPDFSERKEWLRKNGAGLEL